MTCRSKFSGRFVDTWPDTQIKISADLSVDIDGGGTDGHGDGVVITGGDRDSVIASS